MEMKYDLDLDGAVEVIKKNNAKVVCLQLPDGLKQYGDEIVEELQKKTDAKIALWMGSCWGACDVPIHLEKLGVDLVIQWGHSEWKVKYWENA